MAGPQPRAAKLEDEVMRKTRGLVNLSLRGNAEDAPRPGTCLRGLREGSPHAEPDRPLLVQLQEAGVDGRPT